MSTFDKKYFSECKFSDEQISKHLKNALNDLAIAKKDKILDVKFNYTYTALLKSAIALLSSKQLRVKSMPGHHIRLLEVLSDSLKDESVSEVGNSIRSKRNIGLYSGGIEVSEKEVNDYLSFVEKIINKVKQIILK